MSRAIAALLKQFGPATGGTAPTIAVPTLTVVDNEDGTGAVATIAGSTAGSTNTVYTAPWPAATFTSQGSRSSDGTVALSITTTGPYWGYVLSSIDGFTKASGLIAFRVTDGGESIFYRCLEAARDQIRGLSLPGITSEKIVWQKLPFNMGKLTEGIFVTPQPETNPGGSNIGEDIGYAVMVTMIKSSNHALATGFSTVSRWREKIRQCFAYQNRVGAPLPGVSEVYYTRFEAGTVIWPAGFQQQYDVGSLVIRCFAREPAAIS